MDIKKILSRHWTLIVPSVQAFSPYDQCSKPLMKSQNKDTIRGHSLTWFCWSPVHSGQESWKWGCGKQECEKILKLCLWYCNTWEGGEMFIKKILQAVLPLFLEWHNVRWSIHIHTNTDMQTHIHAYTCINTHIYAYTYTHSWKQEVCLHLPLSHRISFKDRHPRPLPEAANQSPSKKNSGKE